MEDAERERRDREERLRHGRNPAARGMPSASRPRGTQDVAPPAPLTPTSHTGENTQQTELTYISNSSFFSNLQKSLVEGKKAASTVFSRVLHITIRLVRKMLYILWFIANNELPACMQILNFCI